MFYTIYKTTNKITGELYIGQHVTNNLNDGYLGSGVGILESIKIYGRGNFNKEILHIFDNETDMNQKEIELVDETFLSNPLVINRQSGGTSATVFRKSVVVLDDKKWKRINVDEYDPQVHITPTSGTIRVFDTQQKVWKRIPSNEYKSNKKRYKTSSTNKVSVLHMETDKTSSINLEDYDSTKHKKVLGGIVAEVDGILQYVTKEQFIESGLRGCHANKVTALDKNDGRIKHITKEEFRVNRTRYKSSSEGKVTVYDKVSEKTCVITATEFHANPTRYNGTTTGEKTVWIIEEKKFKNIPKELFDRKYHRLAGDKRILCFNLKGDKIIDFWGAKVDFIKLYGNEIYNQAIKETKNYQPKHRKKFENYIGCSFELIDWRKLCATA